MRETQVLTCRNTNIPWLCCEWNVPESSHSRSPPGGPTTGCHTWAHKQVVLWIGLTKKNRRQRTKYSSLDTQNSEHTGRQLWVMTIRSHPSASDGRNGIHSSSSPHFIPIHLTSGFFLSSSSWWNKYTHVVCALTFPFASLCLFNPYTFLLFFFCPFPFHLSLTFFHPNNTVTIMISIYSCLICEGGAWFCSVYHPQRAVISNLDENPCRRPI